MKPPKFDYFDPTTIEEVVDLLGQYGPDARVLAGGQSLIPLMNFRLARPAVVVDINRVEALDYVSMAGEKLAIGAMTRQRVLATDAIRSRCGLLTEAATFISHPQIRNRGTVGGSVAHADPAAELPAIVRALDGEMRVRGPQGERTIEAKDFFVGVLTTAMEPSEMLVEVRLPVLGPDTGWALEEVALRHGDFAIAGVTAVVTVDANETCADVRMAAISVSGTPFRELEAERLLVGEKISDSLFEEAGHRLAQRTEPSTDLHASAEQRRHLVGVLAKKALKRAAESALANLRRGDKTNA